MHQNVVRFGAKYTAFWCKIQRVLVQNMTKTATEIVAKWPQNVKFYALFSLE